MRWARWIVALGVLTMTVGPAAAGPVSSSERAPGVAGVTVAGVDAHDGMVYEDAGVLYWAGTKYGCGFRFLQPNTPWCGFGVWTAPGPAGPWTYVRDLFDRVSSSATYRNESWQAICGSTGDGCFNPRMVRRPDGVWILSFSAGYDGRRYGANGYYFMGCNGPAGPCGAGAGPPYGSTIKPALYICRGGGDQAVLIDGPTAYLVCTGATGPQQSLSIERLDGCWCNGVGVGATDLAGLTWVESPGAYRDPGGAVWVLTFSDTNCAYCSGTGTGYAVAAGPLGPWRVPAGALPRRRVSPHSCGGQPRTVITIGGQAYEQIDTWYDSPSETNAATRLEPLIPTGAPWLGPVNGQPWVGPLRPFTCS